MDKLCTSTYFSVGFLKGTVDQFRITLKIKRKQDALPVLKRIGYLEFVYIKSGFVVVTVP
jgi:hypothetical protein